MQGDQEVVRFLNQVLRNELTAINQYFLHARMFDNWGCTALGAYEYKESIDEMRHADELTQRILLLEGLPNLQELGKLYVGENLRECLECDLRLEREAMPVLRSAIAHCETQRDYITRELFEKILEGEEEHVDWLETQLNLVDTMGLENYIQSAVHDDPK